MATTQYARVVRIPQARMLLVFGFLLRVPMFGVSVILTMHVVQTLHRSWAQAGFVTAVATIAAAISGPWRGRLLDSMGLRRVVAPSIAVTAVCWMIAPFSSYEVLLVLAAIAGLFSVPTFTILRQGLIAVTHDDDRRSALALDGVIVEFAFMVGPLLAIALINVWSTSIVICGFEMVTALLASALVLFDPPMRTDEASAEKSHGWRDWVSPRFVAVCLVGFAAVVVLAGSDVSFVAAAKHFHQTTHLGYVLLIWGFASALGGLLYGALPKTPNMFALLAALAAATIPIAFAGSMWALAAWAFLAGLFCAPTMTASVEALSHVVPESVRGEAMGWHGSALTLGGALGGPLAGFFIDAHGFSGGFMSVGVAGFGMAAGGVLLMSLRRGRRRSLKT